MTKLLSGPLAAIALAFAAAACCGVGGCGQKDAKSDTVYTCTMHPEVAQSAPGNCPKCGMSLVPKK